MAVGLRVATFNIQHGRRPDGVVDLGLLAGTVAQLGADVVGLQEVDAGTTRAGGADQAAAVADAAGMVAVFGASCQLAGGDYGNALLVRGEVLESETLPLPGRGEEEPRSVLTARVALTAGPELHVVVTHLSTAPASARAQLQAVSGHLGALPAPKLLLGDLNLDAPAVVAAVAGAGLQLVGGRPTFPAHRPRVRIDHVAAAGFTVRGVTTAEAPVSDHRPLVVDLEC